MKIQVINLKRLHNEEHFQLMVEIRNLIAASPPAITDAVAPVYPRFVALIEREDLALERLNKSIYTDSIEQADAARGGVARSVRQIAKAYTRSLNPAEKTAATHVLAYLNLYGAYERKSYNEETAIIHNLTEDLTTHCAAELAAIHLDGWISSLQDANSAFEQLMTSRYSEGAGRNKDNLRALRRDVDVACGQIAGILNAAIIQLGEAGYAEFVHKMNERIGYYRKTIARRNARNHPDGNGDDD